MKEIPGVSRRKDFHMLLWHVKLDGLSLCSKLTDYRLVTGRKCLGQKGNLVIWENMTRVRCIYRHLRIIHGHSYKVMFESAEHVFFKYSL